MKKMDIDKLLESYFEGETSLEEEKQIRDFFTHTPVEKIPFALRQYAPLFGYFEEEGKRMKKSASSSGMALKWYYVAASVAVAAAIIIGVVLTVSKPTITVVEPVLTMKIGGVVVEDDQMAQDFANEQMQKLSRMMNGKIVDQKMSVLKKMILRADNIINIDKEEE